MSKGVSRNQRIEQYQSLPRDELLRQHAWARKTVKLLQRDEFEMRTALKRQRRKPSP